jgi:hypothetical protein
VVNIKTTAAIPASAQTMSSFKYALAVSLVLLGFGGMKRSPPGKLLGVLFVLLMVVGLETGCGGGSSGGGVEVAPGSRERLPEIIRLRRRRLQAR